MDPNAVFSPSHLESVERRIAALDGTEQAAAFASGSAALSTALLALLAPGDHVVASQPLPKLVRSVFVDVAPRLGCQVTFVEAGPDTVAAIREEAARIKADRLRLLWAQTPADPTNALVDIEGVAHLADRLSFRRERRVLTAIDNTVLGPLFQKPVHHGSDLVFYSDLGVLTGPAGLINPISTMRDVLGTKAVSFTGWMLENMLETMAVRTLRQTETATCLANALVNHRAVERVLHLSLVDRSDPQHEILRRQVSGFGALIPFQLKGGKSAAEKVVARLELIHAEIVGDLIRMSANLVPATDLEGDLVRALEAVRSMPNEREDVRTTQIIRVPLV